MNETKPGTVSLKHIFRTLFGSLRHVPNLDSQEPEGLLEIETTTTKDITREGYMLFLQ